MRYLGPGELRVIGRLVIDPSLSQANLAKELGVSRSAVNQIWSTLYKENNLRIRSNFDFGKFGVQMIFGWAVSSTESDVLAKFSRWLKSSHLTTTVLASLMTSTFDSRVYFEAVIPANRQSHWFLSQVDRFRKKPYSLDIFTSDCMKISEHMNLGLFDGTEWLFPNNFRLEASIGAASGYVDILPVEGTVEQSAPSQLTLDNLLIASVLETNYHTTATELNVFYANNGLPSNSGRTLRRKLARIKKDIVRPYVEINGIGLDQRLMVCIRNENNEESTFAKVLHAQAGTFPKARVVSGQNLTLLELEVPSSVEWLELSQVLSSLAGNATEICTFIADKSKKGTRLESVVSHLASRTSSG